MGTLKREKGLGELVAATATVYEASAHVHGGSAAGAAAAKPSGIAALAAPDK